MRDTIEHAVTRFVDRVLALLRDARLEEVIALREAGEAIRPGPLPARPRQRALRRPRPAPAQRQSATAATGIPDLAEEITDPIALLGGVPAQDRGGAATVTERPTAQAVKVVPPPPESGERLVETAPSATVSLRAGEAIVRATSAGVVIRRHKRVPFGEQATVTLAEPPLAHAPPS